MGGLGIHATPWVGVLVKATIENKNCVQNYSLKINEILGRIRLLAESCFCYC